MQSLPTAVFVAMAVLAGGMVSIQAPINARLGQVVGHPLWATLISFAVGTATVALLLLINRVPGRFAELAALPWWSWIGGMLGAFFVGSALVIAPRIGAAALVAAVVAGQMAASLAVDHYGWFGMPRQPVDGWKIAGAGLILAGLWLIRR